MASSSMQVATLPIISIRLKCDRTRPFVVQNDGSILFAAREQRDMAGMTTLGDKRLVIISRKNKTVKVFGEFLGMGLLREGEKVPEGKGVLLHRIGERMQFTLFTPIEEKEAAKLKMQLNKREHD